MRSLILLLLLATPAVANHNMVVRGNTAFAFDLYTKLAPGKGNLLFSPYSVSSALALAWAGARGATERELARALRFGNEADVHAAFHELNAQLARAGSSYQLSIANRLFATTRCRLLDSFTALARSRYGSEVERLDFALDSSRLRINDWVREQTQNRITNLLARGSVDGRTILLLVNAIYFKGTWETQFAEATTALRPFTVDGKTFDVPTMHRGRTLERYAESDGLQVLELAYHSGDVSMIVLLPREKNGLRALEDRLDSVQFDRWMSELRPKNVSVYLPKFRIAQTVELKESMRKLGIVTAFDPTADFSGINGERDLYISTAVHKTFVEVNEQGTEAAAATGLVFRGLGVPTPEPEFRADHPFVFVIRDTRSGTLLFLGRVVDPR